MDETISVLVDVIRKLAKTDRLKTKLIVFLVIMLAVEPIVIKGIDAYIESQYDYVETYGSDIEISTEGDNASAEYNNVGGDQYNDNATHNEGGVE